MSTLRSIREPGEEVIVVAHADLTRESLFGESWLALTSHRLIVMESRSGRRGTRAASTVGRDLNSAVTTPPQYEVIENIRLERVYDVEAREDVGSGGIVVVVRDSKDESGPTQEIELARYSRSAATRFADFAEAIKWTACWAREDRTAKNDEIPPPREEARCETCDRPITSGADSCPYCLDKRALVVRMLGYLKRYRAATAIALFLTVAGTGLALAPPFLTKVLIDSALPRGDTRLLWLLCGAYAGRFLLDALLSGIRSRLVGVLGQQIILDLRSDLCRHLHDLSLSYFDRRHVGAVMSRVMNDTSAINTFLVSGVQQFMINVLTMVFIGVIMFTSDWKLAMLALTPTPLMALLTRWFAVRVQPIYRRYWGSMAAMNGVLATAISGVRVVKSFAQEPREVERFIGTAEAFREASLDANRVSSIYSPTLTLLTGIGAVLVWAVGGLAVIHHTVTIGTVLMFTGYMWQFFAPVQSLCNLTDQVQSATTAADRVFQMLDTPPDVRDRPEASPHPVKGQVEFDRVTFRYVDSEGGAPVLQDISLTASPGELVGIVGHSGSGKTSLMNLLLRFYDPTQGQIRIDGVDLRDLSARALREQIGMVLQEAFLFSGTIADNIAYGRPDASVEEIVQAAKDANAHRFIMKFPDAYDTEVGERGVKLSGGEKQRISIARAILNDPRILVLDEATSAVDTETEALIQQAMERLMEGHTTFAIAHRLSTLRNASKLIVLDKGRIVETGTHDELMQKPDGLYAKLVRIQTELNRQAQAA